MTDSTNARAQQFEELVRIAQGKGIQKDTYSRLRAARSLLRHAGRNDEIANRFFESLVQEAEFAIQVEEGKRMEMPFADDLLFWVHDLYTVRASIYLIKAHHWMGTTAEARVALDSEKRRYKVVIPNPDTNHDFTVYVPLGEGDPYEEDN